MKKTAIENYKQFIQQVDLESKILADIHANYLECKKGCSDCCKVERTVFGVEAENIIQQLDALPTQERTTILEKHAPQQGTCPFLIDDACSIYSFRPLICRTHGLPLLYLDDDMENWNLTFCEKNFTATPEDFSFDDEYLNMEHLNKQLADIQKQHHEESSGSPRVSLREIIKKIVI